MNLIIDPEFKALIPPLTESEVTDLEAKILAEGFKHPLTVWKGENIIVDGHHRLEICERNNIAYTVDEMEFADRETVIVWMIQNQRGRRNLEAGVRISLARRLESIFAERAKRNMEAGGGDQKSEEAKSGSLILANPILDPVDTRAEVAKVAGVSQETYRRGKAVLDNGDEELKRAYIGGEIKTNTAYNKVKEKEEVEKEKASIEYAVFTARADFRSTVPVKIGQDRKQAIEYKKIALYRAFNKFVDQPEISFMGEVDT